MSRSQASYSLNAATEDYLSYPHSAGRGDSQDNYDDYADYRTPYVNVDSLNSPPQLR